MLLFDGLTTAGGAALVLSLVAAGAGLVAVRRYTADDSPDEHVAVADVTPGAVATSGRVEELEGQTIAPLVPTDDVDPVVVAYHIERRPPGADAWEVVERGGRAVPFVVADGSSRIAVVLDAGGEVALDQLDLGDDAHRHRVDGGAPTPLHDDHADLEPRTAGDAERRYVARYVEPGDQVYVEGDCDGRTAVAGQSVYLVESNEPRAFVSDDPDGPRVEPPSRPDWRVDLRTQLVALFGIALLSGGLAVVAVVDLVTAALARAPIG